MVNSMDKEAPGILMDLLSRDNGEMVQEYDKSLNFYYLLWLRMLIFDLYSKTDNYNIKKTDEQSAASKK